MADFNLLPAQVSCHCTSYSDHKRLVPDFILFATYVTDFISLASSGGDFTENATLNTVYLLFAASAVNTISLASKVSSIVDISI